MAWRRSLETRRELAETIRRPHSVPRSPRLKRRGPQPRADDLHRARRLHHVEAAADNNHALRRIQTGPKDESPCQRSSGFMRTAVAERLGADDHPTKRSPHLEDLASGVRHVRAAPGTQAVIDAVLANQHTLAIMPTGAGKSLVLPGAGDADAGHDCHRVAADCVDARPI